MPGIYVDAVLDEEGLVALLEDHEDDYLRGFKGNSSKKMGRSKVKRSILIGLGWKVNGKKPDSS